MFITKNIDNRPFYKYLTWFTLFTFFINILSYSVFAYPVSTEQKTENKISIGSVVNSILNLFASDAEAAEEFMPYVSDFGAGASNINKFTGAFSYSYPIQVPPGRGGLAPSISLNYSSAGKNDWVGVGWNLPVSYIERDTKFGKPDYNDNDAFVINMGNYSSDLVLEDSEYRMKDEGSFLRVVKSSDTWIVTDKSGTTYYFGTTTDSKLDEGSGTFRWYLTEIEDKNGNEVVYSYYYDSTYKTTYLS